jgi:hypothetical protein
MSMIEHLPDFSSNEVATRAANESERRRQGLNQLRQMIDAAEEDVVAGRVGVFDRDGIKRDVRARLARTLG